MNYFSFNPLWHEKIGKIYALLERVKISEEKSKDVLHLRKTNRILNINATTSIEGNRLSIEQVRDIINGKDVWGPPKDIREVQNTFAAYEQIPLLNPYSVSDFLKAHRLITSDLVQESGEFRTGGVYVVNSQNDILHSGANYHEVPHLVEEVLNWGATTETHPLLASSAIHFMIEHIHPFRDGNGRIGRLWQTLLLSRWNALFEWMPVETIIYHNQARYYEVLQASHSGKVIDCKPFIDFMMEVIENSLYKFIDVSTKTVENVGVKDENVGVKDKNVSVKDENIQLISENSSITVKELAFASKKTTRTIERHLKQLREEGILERIGSDKTGIWKIINSKQ